MALRIRLNGQIVCAAATEAQPGDCYLDDAVHARLAGAEPTSLGVLVTDDDGETWRFVGPARYDCAACGVGIGVDEDGCCARCGRDAYPVEPDTNVALVRDEGIQEGRAQHAAAHACDVEVETEACATLIDDQARRYAGQEAHNTIAVILHNVAAHIRARSRDPRCVALTDAPHVTNCKCPRGGKETPK